ncbi:MAG TPA: ABC transporter permease [Polyangiaceae bacterium]|nr:ABC transporter permease [Polyangiaceae bacterium]
MGFALDLALRYLRSRKRGFISLSTLFAVIGVALGTAALVAVMSVTGGFRAQFQKKVLGVNGHVIVLRSPFRDYRHVMDKVRAIPEVLGVSPFVLNAVMLSHAGRTATGVTFKGVDPSSVGSVLDLPEQIVDGSLDGLASPAPPALPPEPQSWTALELEKALPVALDAGAPRGVSALPAGSIVPEGGYASVLPDEDVLPEELALDPCRAPLGNLPGIVVGVGLQQVLQLKVGDCVQATSPTIGYTLVRGQVLPPVVKQFKVIGIFEAGFEQYDARFAYTDFRETQAFYSDGDSVTGVEVKVADVDRAREVAQRVDEELGNKLYRVIDWMELNHGLFTALRIQQILMSLVLGIIILVAAFTVVATLIMLVLDKKKEIATMKAMGATDAQLLRAFLYQGLFIGLAGAGLGLSFGYVVCRWILSHGFALDPKVYFIDRLPVLLRPQEFALTGAFAIAACLLATIWPALQAARLRPVDAFRD